MDGFEATPRATGEFNAAEIGALAHLYCGEIYRSTAWRTRSGAAIFQENRRPLILRQPKEL